MTNKLRVHTLAADLGVSSKEIIAKCHAEGITALKNHMSVVSLGLAESIRKWFPGRSDVTTVEAKSRAGSRAPRQKKLRVHTLARELGVSSEDILAKCREEHIDALRTPTSQVTGAAAEVIRQWFSDNADDTSISESSSPAPQTPRRLTVAMLANELDVSSEDIIARCKALGTTVLKTDTSVVSPGLAETIREWFHDSIAVAPADSISPQAEPTLPPADRTDKFDPDYLKAPRAADTIDEFDAPPLVLLLDPGTATGEEIAQLLYEFSTLYRMLGGSGITFTVTDAREPAFA